MINYFEKSSEILESLYGVTKHKRDMTSNENMKRLIEIFELDISNLNVIHVAGTVGKGSFCIVYIVVGTGEGGEFTHGKDSFMNEILNICGYTNAGADADGFKYTLEKLIKKNPTYLLTPGWATETVKTGAAYKGLSAVKNGKVVQINEDIFSRASNRVVTEGLKELLKIAHPEVIKDLEF